MVESCIESPKASVVITTKNRKEDLARATASALEQTGRPEVLIIDDGSTDGTAEMIKRRFPTVCLHRSEVSMGLIVQRNRAARLATTPFLVSIDDDAIFSSPGVVETTLGEFSHPRVGAVAIPFVDVNRSSEVHQKAPSAKGIYATYSYIGTAHALRRDLFLALSGYRETLFHQGEEEDYCIRLLEAGYITRCGNSDPVHHYESPRRSWARMDYYGARNKVLYAWHNVPLPYLPGHLAVATAKALGHSLSPNRFCIRLRGVLAAFVLFGANRSARRAVSRSAYRLSRSLKRSGGLPLQRIEPLLPEVKPPRPNDLLKKSLAARV
jgi:glycosyltransferase involved in cell wall biosynthesis